MKPLPRLAVRLYPARWRERYGPELEALLEDSNAGACAAWDVARGALDMRMKDLAPVSIGLALVGALGGTIVSLRQPTLYESSATLRLMSSGTKSVEAIVHGAFGRGTHPAGDVDPHRLMVLIDDDQTRSDGSVLRLGSLDTDATAAQRITQRLVDTLTKGLAAQGAPVAIETLMSPTLPTEPSRPNHLAFAGSGGGVGLILGALAGWLRRRSPGTSTP